MQRENMNTETKKDNSFKFRMDEVTMSLLEKARSYINVNKSKFIRQSIREKAESIIAKHDETHFTESDWLLFFEMIDKPKAPTDRMKKAAIKYQEIIDSK